MSDIQNIVPTEQATSITINAFRVDVIRLTLFESAVLRAIMYDADENQVLTQVVELKGEDYLNWSTNDEYIYQYVAQQLGFTLTVK